MGRNVAIGIQNFYEIRENNYFYVDKTLFIKEWWESGVLSEAEKRYFDQVTNGLSEENAPMAVYQLSDFLYRYYGKKEIVLLDEYDIFNCTNNLFMVFLISKRKRKKKRIDVCILN